MDVEPSSRLAGDDARTPHHPVSSYAYAQLIAALGCLKSLERMSIRGNGDTINMTLSPYGVYALIRNALDTVATAMWLLEPGTTARVERRLLLGVDEVKNTAAFRSSLNQEWSEWNLAKRARLQEVAASAGLENWDPLAERVPTMTSILQHLECHHQNVVMPWLATWQLASGHAHGKLWAQVASHQMNEMPGTKTDVGATFLVTISYGMLAVVLFEAVQLIETAGSRYIELAKAGGVSAPRR